jgi:hypothetical protein
LAAQPDLARLMAIERAEVLQGEKPAFFLYRDERLQRWRKMLTKLQREHLVRQLDPDVISAALAIMAYGIAVAHEFVGAGSPAARAQGLTDILFNGIQARATPSRNAVRRVGTRAMLERAPRPARPRHRWTPR